MIARMVRALVLAEPGVAGVLTDAPKDEAARKEGQIGRAEMTEVFASGNAERIMRTYATRVAPGAYEKAGREVRQGLLDNAPAFQLDYNSRRLPFTCEIAGQISMPALFLAGERSPLGLQHIAEKAAGCLKNAKFVRIPQATHWIPHDQPQKFNEALLGFLSHYKQPELIQHVDHLVYATPDLDRGIDEIEKLLGVRATLGRNIPGEGPGTLSSLSAQTLSWRSLHPIRINRRPKSRAFFSRALRNLDLSDGSLTAVTSRSKEIYGRTFSEVKTKPAIENGSLTRRHFLVGLGSFQVGSTDAKRKLEKRSKHKKEPVCEDFSGQLAR